MNMFSCPARVVSGLCLKEDAFPSIWTCCPHIPHCSRCFHECCSTLHYGSPSPGPTPQLHLHSVKSLMNADPFWASLWPWIVKRWFCFTTTGASRDFHNRGHGCYFEWCPCRNKITQELSFLLKIIQCGIYRRHLWVCGSKTLLY
jgi:hypothetical protein